MFSINCDFIRLNCNYLYHLTLTLIVDGVESIICTSYIVKYQVSLRTKSWIIFLAHQWYRIKKGPNIKRILIEYTKMLWWCKHIRCSNPTEPGPVTPLWCPLKAAYSAHTNHRITAYWPGYSNVMRNSGGKLTWVLAKSAVIFGWKQNFLDLENYCKFEMSHMTYSPSLLK